MKTYKQGERIFNQMYGSGTVSDPSPIQGHVCVKFDDGLARILWLGNRKFPPSCFPQTPIPPVNIGDNVYSMVAGFGKVVRVTPVLINCEFEDGNTHHFHQDGKYTAYSQQRALFLIKELLVSGESEIPTPTPPLPDPKPGMAVLVRATLSDLWKPDVFIRAQEQGYDWITRKTAYSYCCARGVFPYCIPLTEETAHLFNTPSGFNN